MRRHGSTSRTKNLNVTIEFVIPYIVNTLSFPILLLNIRLIFRMPLELYGGITEGAQTVPGCVLFLYVEKLGLLSECAFCED
jgi:hypothetical protein